MPNPLWLLRDPSGRVIGASANGAQHAVNDAWRFCLIPDDLPRRFDSVIKANPTASTYTVDGYTLARKEMDG